MSGKNGPGEWGTVFSNINGSPGPLLWGTDFCMTGHVMLVLIIVSTLFGVMLSYSTFDQVKEEWRLVTGFIEDSPYLVKRKERMFDTIPRRLEFDERKHMSLNAELKYLYTAITRVKCNLWIYDSDKEKRLPMFDYWNKRGLVKVMHVNKLMADDCSTPFLESSSREEWKTQGDLYKRKKLWEAAVRCYHNAECHELESEARAHSFIQQARTSGLKQNKMNEIFLKAALSFLESDQFHHNYQCLQNAAKCLNLAQRSDEFLQLSKLLNQA